VIEYATDHERVFDGSNDLHVSAAVFAAFDVDLKHPLETLCPTHRAMPFGGRCRLRGVALASTA